jgi:hypothetical protein
VSRQTSTTPEPPAKRIRSSADTSVDNIEEPIIQTRMREILDKVKEDRPRQLTPFPSTATIMATQVTTTSLGSRTLTDSELLALQIAQQNQAAAMTLSRVEGQGNTVPPGAAVGIPAGGGGRGNLPARGGRGGGGGGGGGPPAVGGGGNPPAGGQPANPAPQVQQNPADRKILGVAPLPFTGERDRAEKFIDSVEDHFLLNHQFTPYHSFCTKITYTLSLLQGPDVAS